MLISSSRALRGSTTCRAHARFATAVPPADPSPPRPEGGPPATAWTPALAPGQYPLYDLALDSLAQSRRWHQRRLQQAKASGTATADDLERIEADAFRGDPDVRWNLRHGRADYTKPVYRLTRQERWRRYGDLARVMQKITDDFVVPDLFTQFTPTVEMLLRTDAAPTPQSGGMLPGRPVHPRRTIEPPHIRAFVPHPDERLYTLALIDPDAPDEQHVGFQEKWHWLRLNVPLSPLQQDPAADGDTVLPYVPPHPEQGTPRHRYVLVLAAQDGRIDTSELWPRHGQLLWRSFLERHRARLASAFHWVCGNNDWTRDTVSHIYRDILREREPDFIREYRPDKMRLFGAVGRNKDDI